VTETLPPPAATEADAPAAPRWLRPTRSSVRHTAAELLAGSVLAVVVSMGLQYVISRLHIAEPSWVPQALSVAGGAGALLVLVAIIVFGYRSRPRWLLVASTWATLATFSTVVAATPIQNTKLYYGGTAGDNAFRMQYLTRMASTWHLADMNYADAAPYYPAGWFWLGGRFANLFGYDGWEAYKPYALTWVAVAAVVAFALWSLVVDRRLAALAALATTLIGMATGGFSWTPTGIGEPYAWPAAAWLAPVAVLTWRTFGLRTRPSLWTLFGIGCYLGFAGMTYSLYFGFAVLVTVSMAVLRAALRVRGGEPIRPLARGMFRRLVPIGATSLALMLLVWTPYLTDKVLLGAPPSAAPRFFPEGSAFLPVPMADGNAFGVICLIGLAWIILRCRQHEAAAAMLVVSAAVYFWFGLSALVLITTKSTLLPFRLHGVLEITLAAGGVFGMAEAGDHARRRFPLHAVPIVAFAAVLGFLGAMSLDRTALKENLNGGMQLAYDDYYPTGETAKGAHDPGNEDAYLGDLVTTIGELTGKSPQNNILLNTDYTLMAFKPFWGFQHKTPHYATPLAHYAERNAEIDKWARARTSQQLIDDLDHSPFAPPNVFVLRGHSEPSKPGDPPKQATPDPSDDLTMTVREDGFPQMPGTRDHEAHFDPAVFDSPQFVQRQVGPFTVIARR
jgi:galactan 5-O-arabinofuranosyltransferase